MLTKSTSQVLVNKARGSGDKLSPDMKKIEESAKPVKINDKMVIDLYGNKQNKK